METKLYVGNLPYTTSEDELQAMFAPAGPVKTVTVVRDRDTGRSRGFAFVEMETQADAQKAISMMNGKDLEGRPLTVNMAPERRPFGRETGWKRPPRRTLRLSRPRLLDRAQVQDSVEWHASQASRRVDNSPARFRSPASLRGAPPADRAGAVAVLTSVRVPCELVLPSGGS
jgi:RNA recognition motif-containing protein